MLPMYSYLSSSIFKSYLKLPIWSSFNFGHKVSMSSISIIFIIMMLVIMLCYMLRNTNFLEIYNQTSIVYANTFGTSRNVQVVKINNPFVFNLTSPSQCTLEKVTCKIINQSPCVIRAFWNVTSHDMNTLLYRLDWQTLKEKICDNEFSIGIRDCNEIVKVSDPQESSLVLKPCNKIEPVDLGSHPRSRYPLLVFIMHNDDDSTITGSTVVAMVVAVHIKDNSYNMETSVVLNFLKQANGQCSKLQPLFVANANSTDYNSSSAVTPRCVVCLANAITHALLPCRHMCVCQNCFKLIDKCPMCRGHIDSYFCDTASENKEPEQQLNSTDSDTD